MSEVKPATDSEIAENKTRFQFTQGNEDYHAALLARIESDRAEIEALRTRTCLAGCADGHEPIRWNPAEEWGACPLCADRAIIADLLAALEDSCGILDGLRFDDINSEGAITAQWKANLAAIAKARAEGK